MDIQQAGLVFLARAFALASRAGVHLIPDHPVALMPVICRVLCKVHQATIDMEGCAIVVGQPHTALASLASPCRASGMSRIPHDTHSRVAVVKAQQHQDD